MKKPLLDKIKGFEETKNIVVSAECQCACCKQQAATIFPFLKDRTLTINVKDVIPVCNKCAKIIKQAVADKYIKMDDLIDARLAATNIVTDNAYATLAEWLNTKHYLSDEELKQIDEGRRFVIEKINATLRKKLWFDTIKTVKFLGRDIIKIRQILNVSVFRDKKKG